jgi:hypothetical protein
MERVEEALNFQGSVNRACAALEPVTLRAIYKPFKTSLLAESEDELFALKDLRFVQDHLHFSFTTTDTWKARIEMYITELSSASATKDDQIRIKDCESLLN